MNTTTLRKTITTLSVAAMLPMLASIPAHANDADVVRRGSCSGTADWKVKASPEDGRIEVEAEVDSNRAGQTWRWRLRHNGSLSARGTKQTAGASGSFTVRRVMADLAGDDVFRFRAVDVNSGQVCRGRVTY